MLWLSPHPLILASRSAIRRALLKSAGIPVEVNVPDLDERAIEASAGPLSPREAALLLARQKARAVAPPHAGQLVLGADQTLALDQVRFTKPIDTEAARNQLRSLSGRTHELCSGFAIARAGQVIFSQCEVARLTMRSLSEPFLDAYLQAAGPDVTTSVGGYQLEKLGVHLFERIEGDHSTILGLPLVQLLAFLRHEGSVIA
ncbi:MAG: Maf family nucleotide pyrophosphatase [Xanthobacteraceae bacterium]